MPQLSIKDIFNECQRGIQSHGKLLKGLRKIYDSTPLDDFVEEYLHLLRYSMVIFKREPAVERTIDFVAKFATSLVAKPEGGDADVSQEEEEEMNPFLLKFFSFLLMHHNANQKAVRFRCCQLINKLLNSMGEEAQIDDDLYDKIYECMQQRMRDKFPIVRVQAIFALSRLQDPHDQDCPIINAYLFLLSCDINSDVRRAVLSCVAFSTKTLPAILERTRDIKDTVRKLAYDTIAEKVHIKALSIAQRVRLLQDGLNDRVEFVKEACTARLIQAWLRINNNNILDLLNCLDVENSPEVSEQTIKSLLSKAPIHELVQNFDILNEGLVLPKEHWSSESSFYWRVLCEHVKAAGTSAEEHLDKILPNGKDYCAFVRLVVDENKGVTDVDEQLKTEFILQQLLQLANCLDMSDEVGRQNLGMLMKDLVQNPNVSYMLAKPAIQLYKCVVSSPDAFINSVVEIVSDIRMPITMVDNTLTKDQERARDLKIASIRVKINQAKEELAQAIKNQDFTAAAELKEKVAELDSEKQKLFDDTMPETQEVRTEKSDPDTLLKCLTIAGEMLVLLNIRDITPALQTLAETLILPGVQNPDPAVRNAAVKALGLCCLISKDMAKDHLVLFLQVSKIDIESIRVTALELILDILHLYGFEAFQLDTDHDWDQNKNSSTASSDSPLSVRTTSSVSEEEEEKNNEAASSILSVLIDLLDSESSDVRTVVAEGFAKLLLARRLVSPKLLSRLLLLWYNPLTEDDIHLRHCLGTFFPIYAFAGSANQEVVEQAFMITLSTLFEAPATSPLAEINITNVTELLVQLTNARHLTAAGTAQTQDMNPHDNLCIDVCNEILSEPNSFNVRTLCKILNMMEPNYTNMTLIKDLDTLTHRMRKEVKDKQCGDALKRFHNTIKQCLGNTTVSTEQNRTSMLDITNRSLNQMTVTENTIQNNSTIQSPVIQGSPASSSKTVVAETTTDTNITIDTATSNEIISDTASSVSTMSSQPQTDILDTICDNKVEKEAKKTKRGRNTKTSTAAVSKKKTRNVPPPPDPSDEENDIFASPEPVRRSTRSTRGKGDVDTTKKNLDQDLATPPPTRRTRRR